MADQIPDEIIQHWRDWVQHEIGGPPQRVEAALQGAIAAIRGNRGVDEIVLTARQAAAAWDASEPPAQRQAATAWAASEPLAQKSHASLKWFLTIAAVCIAIFILVQHHHLGTHHFLRP
jgi:hypothetical protein